MKPNQLAKHGRNGDTMVAHINPREARVLGALGGSGTVNPKTGLVEFFDVGDIGDFGDVSFGEAAGNIGDFGGSGIGDGGSVDLSGFKGSPEHGVHHAEVVSDAATGDQAAMDVSGDPFSQSALQAIASALTPFQFQNIYNRMGGEDTSHVSVDPAGVFGGLVGGPAGSALGKAIGKGLGIDQVNLYGGYAGRGGGAGNLGVFGSGLGDLDAFGMEDPGAVSDVGGPSDYDLARAGAPSGDAGKGKGETVSDIAEAALGLREYNPYLDDFATYGQRGEHKFFDPNYGFGLGAA